MPIWLPKAIEEQGEVAQLGEHRPCKSGVAGSFPVFSTSSSKGYPKPLLMGVWQRGSSRGAVTPVFFGRSLVQIQSHPPISRLRVAQLVAHSFWERGVASSSLAAETTIIALLTQLARVLPCLGRSQRFESAAGRQTNRTRNRFRGRLPPASGSHTRHLCRPRHPTSLVVTREGEEVATASQEAARQISRRQTW